MADEKPFRQERRKVQPEDIEDVGPTENPKESLERMAAIRKAAMEQESDFQGEEMPRGHVPDFGGNEGQPQIKGNMPPGMIQAMKAAQGGAEQPKKGFGSMGREPREPVEKFQKPVRPGPQVAASPQLKEMLEQLRGSIAMYEPIELPSKGKFYDGNDGPTDGIIHIRPMTGDEEQILATPRLVRKGTAINQIFSRCIQENYNPERLLTIDRTYLLIYLRGISYSPIYNAEVKCQECDKKFATDLDLNSLFVDQCPDNFGPDLTDILPTSQYRFRYRLSRGRDETEISEYRERRTKMFGDSAVDDTLSYRMAQLLEEIEGLSDKSELQTLLKSLPVNDVSFIRQCVNEPPFGVNTKLSISCPLCLHEFEIDLPFEADFFFPRRKKGSQTQA